MSSRSFTTAQATAKPQAAPPVAAGFAQRQCSCGQHVIGGGKCAECKRKAGLQRKKGDRAQDLGDMDVLSDTVPQTQGQPISGRTRAFMETRFQHDFSQVRVHTDSTAAESALAVNALAYTIGRDIVFGADQYAPHTASGALLLAHELTHVVQQANTAPSASSKPVSDPGDAAEHEADAVASQVVSGNGQAPVAVRQSPNAALHALDQGVGIGIGVGIGVAGVGALAIAALAGAFDKTEFSDQELTNYLAVLDTGRIEGHTDSDNKARALVKRWVTGTSSFLLSPVRKMFMIREMQDGFVSDDDREGILTLLENSPEMGLAAVLSPPLNFPSLLSDLNSGAFANRTVLFFVKRMSLHSDPLLAQFVSWYAKENFGSDQQAMAEKVLRDVLAVSNLDFADGAEFKNEISKRLRISALMRESQADSNGFDYPENIKSNNVNEKGGCADYQAPPEGSIYNPANARVNKAAREYWSNVVTTNGAANPNERNLSYYFDLSPKGKENAYEALKTLFTPQDSICDKTLIHCDYLVNVIQFRTYAETIGIDKFNDYVKGGRILMRLTYTGFSDPYQMQDRPSPKGLGYTQNARPQSRSDLMIGDHVTFWNHLAFDGLNEVVGSPWRLENAVLVDKDAKGEDMFQGHGSGAPVNEHEMLKELAVAFNGLAKPALDATEELKLGHLQQSEFVQKYGHQVRMQQGRWVVVDPGRASFRNGWVYDLRLIDETNPEADQWLPGLKDPMNMNQMNAVDRPIESAPGKAPTP